MQSDDQSWHSPESSDRPTYTSIAEARGMIMRLRGRPLAYLQLVSQPLASGAPISDDEGYAQLVRTPERGEFELQVLFGEFSMQQTLTRAMDVLPALDLALAALVAQYPLARIVGGHDDLRQFDAAHILSVLAEHSNPEATAGALGWFSGEEPYQPDVDDWLI